jgi:hypothetical protein
MAQNVKEIKYVAVARLVDKVILASRAHTLSKSHYMGSALVSHGHSVRTVLARTIGIAALCITLSDRCVLERALQEVLNSTDWTALRAHTDRLSSDHKL